VQTRLVWVAKLGPGHYTVAVEVRGTPRRLEQMAREKPAEDDPEDNEQTTSE